LDIFFHPHLTSPSGGLGVIFSGFFFYECFSSGTFAPTLGTFFLSVSPFVPFPQSSSPALVYPCYGLLSSPVISFVRTLLSLCRCPQVTLVGGGDSFDTRSRVGARTDRAGLRSFFFEVLPYRRREVSFRQLLILKASFCSVPLAFFVWELVPCFLLFRRNSLFGPRRASFSLGEASYIVKVSGARLLENDQERWNGLFFQ